MPLYFPDRLENNNPNYPIADISDIRGNAITLTNLSQTGSSIPEPKRKTGTIIFVSSTQKYYAFYGATTSSANWNNTGNWKELAFESELGSYITTGSVGSTQIISGSLTIQQGITGSVQTASFTPNAYVSASYDNGNLQLFRGNSTSSSFLLNSGAFSGSFNGNLIGTASWATNALTASFFSGSITNAITALTSSYPIALTGSTLYSYGSNILGSTAYNVNPNDNIMLGSQAGLNINTPTSISTIFIGKQAGQYADGTFRSIFIGESVGVNSSASYSHFIGFNAGNSSGNLIGSTFIGLRAGRFAISASYSTIIGHNSGTDGVSTAGSVGRNNIIIGTAVTLEPNRRDSINIGGIIFGTGSYFSTTTISSGSTDGKIGINVVNPQSNFDVSGSVRLRSLVSQSASHIVAYDSSSGQLSYISTASLGSGGSTFPFNGNAVITGSLVVSGSGVTITGSLNVLGTASFTNIIYENIQVVNAVSTGSNTFGNTPDDIQRLIGTTVATGSLQVTGSTTISGSLSVSNGITGSLFGTASWAQSASVAISASFANSASFATSASWAPIPSLEQVTNVGSSSVNTIVISGSDKGIDIFDGANTSYAQIRTTDSGITFQNSSNPNPYFYVYENGNNTAAIRIGGGGLSSTGSVIDGSQLGGGLKYHYLPNANGTFVLRVNGVAADSSGNITIPTGSNIDTSSFVTNSQTSSFVTNSQTSSFVLNSQTSSFVTNNQTGSFATTGSNTFRGEQIISASLYLSGAVVNNTGFVLTYNTASGLVSYTSSAGFGGGGVGTPSPSDTFIQYNSGSQFGATDSFRFIYTSQSFQQGLAVTASGIYSHAEGRDTISSGNYSHVEGFGAKAIGSSSHAEGDNTEAIGEASHAEGLASIAYGDYSHAEGYFTIASGTYSHTAGRQTVAIGDYQSVIGQFNRATTGIGAFIIGNGLNNSNRSNLLFASGSQFQISGSLYLSGANISNGTGHVLTYDNTTGLVTYTSSAALGGGSAMPGGTTGQIQYNNAGAFAGVSKLTYDGTTLKADGLTISGSTGLIVSSTLYLSGASINNTGFVLTYDTASGLVSYTSSAGLGGSSIDTSQFVTNSQTGSFVTNSQTGSFITNTQTGSFVTNSQTSSFVTNSQTSSFVTNSQTSSFVLNSQTGSFVINNQTASFATTGSNTFRGDQIITGSLSFGTSSAISLNDTRRTVTAGAGTFQIYSVPTASYDAVFMEYSAKSGANARAGQFMGIWNEGSVNYTDNSTTDFGNTTALTFSGSISGGNLLIQGNQTGAGIWTVKSIIRFI